MPQDDDSIKSHGGLVGDVIGSEELAMSIRRDGHAGLHGDQGGLPGEHRGRATNPVVKVHGLAWLEIRKPDLVRAAEFARAFGFEPSLRTDDELHLRGTDAGAPCLVVRRGSRSEFVAPAFEVDGHADLTRIAASAGTTVTALPETLGGHVVDLVDPSGQRVRVVAGANRLPALPAQAPLTVNAGHEHPRVDATQRPPRAPARVQRLGHVVLQTTRYRAALDWYLETLGLIVSDFLHYPGQRERGPVMSFIRCDRGAVPTDHHTLAMLLGPSNRYVHSAYEVADLDALAAGGEHLREMGYRRSWGIGRHIQGSQVFDYWRDPDGLLVEHYTDGDVFDSSLEPGWAPMSASGLRQWGPPPTKDFLGIAPGRDSLRELRAMLAALRADNEFDVPRLRGLLAVTRS
jgi:catechol 2,3-dioxygenase-like lactoylglutathione lyase family enzyme